MPKAILITTNEDATAKKKQVKEVKAIENWIEERIEELKHIKDLTIFMQATNKAKKPKGRKRKEKGTDKDTSSTKKTR